MTLLGMGQLGPTRQRPQQIGRLIAGRTADTRGRGQGRFRWFNAAWVTVVCGLGLSLLGVAMIDLGDSPEIHPGGFDLTAQAWKQVVFLIVGLIAAAVVSLPHMRFVQRLSYPLLMIAIGLLALLLVPIVPDSLVRARNGARSWIDLGPLDLQPSELAKIAYVMAVAFYMRNRNEHRTLLGLIVPGVLTAIPVGLITLQPDLGTACLFAPTLFAMLVAAGARFRHLAIIVLCGALAAPAVYPVLKPHQKDRIASLVRQMGGDRSQEQGIAFQPLTAQALIGAGGLHGQPEGRARALIHYNALPARHNDMIFAILVHRYGLLGGVGVCGLYVVWIWSVLAVAAGTRDPFSRLVIVGIAGFAAAQFVVNVGMTIGLLPVIGITLPYMSYGGSSMLTIWLMTGMVVNVAIHKHASAPKRSFEYAPAYDAPPHQDIIWQTDPARVDRTGPKTASKSEPKTGAQPGPPPGPRNDHLPARG